jgi:hypothetical protein
MMPGWEAATGIICISYMGGVEKTNKKTKKVTL